MIKGTIFDLCSSVGVGLLVIYIFYCITFSTYPFKKLINKIRQKRLEEKERSLYYAII